MFCRYGTFDFHPWEASIRVSSKLLRSDRGFKELQVLDFTFSGDVVGADQYDINARLQQIFTAFSTDGQSCGLMHDNGTPSVHWMPNATDEPTNLTDVQVVSMRLPETTNGEFASGRHFELFCTSVYAAHTTELLEHQDRLTRVGNAGPLWKWEKNPTWGHYPRMISPTTMQTIFHQGYAIGATTWPLPPTPFYAPPFEANHKRVVSHESPQRYPAGYHGFKTSWSYEYTLPFFDDIIGPTVA